jgi:hypothetical protein
VEDVVSIVYQTNFTVIFRQIIFVNIKYFLGGEEKFVRNWMFNRNDVLTYSLYAIENQMQA